MTERYELQCRECRTSVGNRPSSVCEECFSPLEVTYDYDDIRTCLTREAIAQRAPGIWRYRELLPVADEYEATLPIGFTPLVPAPQLARHFRARRPDLKYACFRFPTLSYEGRVAAMAMAQARRSG